ncbi:MAG: type II 3-dehydroquinate dehydratase [Clostridiales bacterium]|nr:type II 3-dehydroquinate dehydratase [Clostridiales bacterium]
MKILVIQGPNLNRLGKRTEFHYGAMTLEALNGVIRDYGDTIGFETDFLQSNHEGQLIDWIHESEKKYDAVLINPGAFTHYSYAIRDAIESVDIPFVEVHLSNIYERETFRHVSVIAPVCRKQVYGMKEKSYFDALDYLKTLL